MQDVVVGVIGGSGLYDIEGITDLEEITLDTPFGAPLSRIRRVRRRVSTPAIPTRLLEISQSLKCSVARQLAGSVISARKIQPRAAGVMVSISSILMPTLPICGNVKVTA